MNTYEEELRTKWNGINCHDGGSIQLAVEHPSNRGFMSIQDDSGRGKTAGQ